MGSRWFPLGIFEEGDPDSDEEDNDSDNNAKMMGGLGDGEPLGDDGEGQDWDIAITRRNRRKARRAVKREARIQRKLEKKLALEELKANQKDEFIDFSLPLVALHAPTEEEIDIIFQVPSAATSETEAENIQIDLAESRNSVSESDSETNAWSMNIRDAWLNPNPRKLTENNAPTFSSSGDARVDFFFQVMEKTYGNITEELVSQSWKQDSLDTLKLIAYLRNCRQGKGVRSPYQVCLYWLYKNHPRTLYENLVHLVGFGYWKDLLHFLMTICFEGTIPHYLLLDDSPHLKKNKERKAKSVMQKYQDVKNRNEVSTRKGQPKNPNTRRKDRDQLRDHYWEYKGTLVYNKRMLEMYTKYIDPEFKLKMAIQHLPKKFIRDGALKVARYRLETDSKYIIFFTKIALLFAQQILADQDHMEKGNKKLVSLAGKWAPDLKGHFDKYTLIGTGVALELIKLRNQTFQMEKPFESVRCYLARKVYHKEYLVGLKKYLQLPEVSMSAREWKTVNYKRVPALSMLRNMKIFMNHDKERFEKFVKKVKKIPGMTLKPHQIIGRIIDQLKRDGNADETETVEAGDITDMILEKQWKSLVDDIKNSDGALKNALAICDVSGSMEGEPMIAAISLTFLTMELSEPPWNDFCISFHEEPSVFMVDQNDNLKTKVSKMLEMPWGCNTDLNKVFELILSFANEIKDKTGEVKNTLPKTLLVFTDMEFDEAFSGADETNFEVIKRRFDEEGFLMPNIVFWNLRGGCSERSVPVRKDETGTVLMSGFSGQQLKLVLKNQEVDMEELTPLQVMLRAIKSSSYDDDVLKVYD